MALLSGSFLMVVTMVLHPTGGNIERLYQMMGINITAHSIGIAAVPFTLFGFWGVARRLGSNNALNMLAFTIVALSMVAVVMAAAMNGLVLPFFLQSFQDTWQQSEQQVRLVLTYNFAVNRAMDYIFIVGICAGMALWSVVVVRTKQLGAWVGWVGLVISAGAVVFLASGANLIHLHGFRLFIFSIVAWIALMGIQLVRGK